MLFVVAVLAVGVASATAGGGNSPNAKPARLTVTAAIYDCGGTCWGIIDGYGLKAHAVVDIYAPGLIGVGVTDSNGNFGGTTPGAGGLGFSCGAEWRPVPRRLDGLGGDEDR